MANTWRDEAKERLWRERLTRQGSSDLTVREFCQREGVMESSFYAWRRTIAERDRTSDRQSGVRRPRGVPAFVPMVVTEEPARGKLRSNYTGIDILKCAQEWGLDATGNWGSFKQDNNGDGTWELNQTRTSNVVNEITAIAQTPPPPPPPPPLWATPAYNSAGNMTSVPRPADPAQTFVATYDAWNRLVKLTDGTNTVAEYVYEGPRPTRSRRSIMKAERTVKRSFTAGSLSETRHYYYSQGWQILEERVGSGSPSSLNPDRQYLWGLQYVDQLICRWRRLTTGINDEVLYAVQDANWNVTGIWGQVSGTWQLRQRQSYDPYGQVTYLNPTTFAPTTDAFDLETLYAGYRHDKETRMYQVRNRYYNTALGTWVSRDPMEERALQRNVLAYSDGNPAGSVDPFGLYTAKTTITGDMKGEFQRNRYFGKGPPPDLTVR
jgi:RHS repeat-associated protein